MSYKKVYATKAYRHITTPSTDAPSNFSASYFKSDGKLYSKTGSSEELVSAHGADNNIQFKSSTGFSSSSNLTFNSSTNKFRVTGTIEVGDPSSGGFALPTSDATVSGQALVSDSNGTVTWQTISGGGGIGGSIADTQVAYGNGTDIAGSANFIWDYTNNRLSINNPLTKNANINVKGQGITSSTSVAKFYDGAATPNLLYDFKDNGTFVIDGQITIEAKEGFNNVIVGDANTNLTITAQNNTFVGNNTGSAITSQASNTFIGASAGQNTVGANNTFVGLSAGQSCSANDVIAIGYRSLRTPSGTPLNTVSIGNSCGISFAGNQSVLIGDSAGQFAASTSTILGFRAGQYTSNSRNTLIGAFAGQGSSGVSTFERVTATGRDSGKALTTGSFNCLYGYGSAIAMTEGEYNLVFGYNAGIGMTTGDRNVVIGPEAGGSGGTIWLTNQSNLLVIENTAGTDPLLYGDFANDQLGINWNNATALTATLNVNGDIRQTVHTDNVSNLPTDAELDSIFGTPATVGAGYSAYIDDNGAGNNFYLVVSDGTNWWTQAMTKAV